jgi:uncharacterized protein DUF3489/resolvase-like protein
MSRPAANRTRRSGTIRCAIYTRKSSEEGLEQEFNSLQAQREACEAFIKSQRHEGWVCLPDGYDDGGLSGATMERPALQQLLAEIQAGRVDIVVVYKKRRRVGDRDALIDQLWSAIEMLPDPDPQSDAKRPSKQDAVIAMLRRPEGATVDEVASATGWQRHTVRGVFSGTLKKKLGLILASAQEERGRVYRIAEPASV